MIDFGFDGPVMHCEHIVVYYDRQAWRSDISPPATRHQQDTESRNEKS